MIKVSGSSAGSGGFFGSPVWRKAWGIFTVVGFLFVVVGVGFSFVSSSTAVSTRTAIPGGRPYSVPSSSPSGEVSPSSVSSSVGVPSAKKGEGGDRPNVVLIVADDLRKGVAEPVLFNTNKYVTSRGVTFTNMVVTTPHCCPSRSMLLSGKYAHTTGVWDNGEVAGGWKVFKGNGFEQRTLAVALQKSGYRTALMGKYLNGYTRLSNKPKPIPPGWNVFNTFTNIGKTGAYFDYALTGVGQFGSGEEDYSTDVLARHAVDFIEGTKSDRPLFLMLTPYAPHSPYQPAPRHAIDAKAELPIDKSLRSAEGKPGWVQASRGLRTEKFFNHLDRRRARERATMRSFDDAVGSVAEALQKSGRLENTIFVVTSDNGYLHGEFGLAGKNLPYRAVTDVPLYVAWPAGGLPEGSDSRLATMVDVPTSIAAAAGVSMDTEGINLFASPTGSNVRSGVMLEGTSTDPARPAYCGYRTTSYRFARYSDGSSELYDLRADPEERTNVIRDREYRPVRNMMRIHAKRLCQPTAPGFAWNKFTPTRMPSKSVGKSATEE